MTDESKDFEKKKSTAGSEDSMEDAVMVIPTIVVALVVALMAIRLARRARAAPLPEAHACAGSALPTMSTLQLDFSPACVSLCSSSDAELAVALLDLYRELGADFSNSRVFTEVDKFLTIAAKAHVAIIEIASPAEGATSTSSTGSDAARGLRARGFRGLLVLLVAEVLPPSPEELALLSLSHGGDIAIHKARAMNALLPSLPGILSHALVAKARATPPALTGVATVSGAAPAPTNRAEAPSLSSHLAMQGKASDVAATADSTATPSTMPGSPLAASAPSRSAANGGGTVSRSRMPPADLPSPPVAVLDTTRYLALSVKRRKQMLAHFDEGGAMRVIAAIELASRDSSDADHLVQMLTGDALATVRSSTPHTHKLPPPAPCTLHPAPPPACGSCTPHPVLTPALSCSLDRRGRASSRGYLHVARRHGWRRSVPRPMRRWPICARASHAQGMQCATCTTRWARRGATRGLGGPRWRGRRCSPTQSWVGLVNEIVRRRGAATAVSETRMRVAGVRAAAVREW